MIMKKIIFILIFSFFTLNLVNAEEYCTREYNPVIWSDWKIYSNPCLARNAWVYVESKKIDNEKILNSYLDFSLKFPVAERDSEIFLKKYWNICQTATDSINFISIEDSNFFSTTLILPPENFKPNYTCLSYKWLSLDDKIKKNFEKSLEKLSVLEIKKINFILKDFYSKEKDFLKNLEKTKKLVEKIDILKKNTKSEKNILILDYIKYQVINLFTKK